jgi:hypothetical protein
MMDAREWARNVRPSPEVIEAVSYHVDDMRLLVNMLNEYDLMRAVLGKNAELDKDKMFAAVASRCLFPREYAQLLRGRGVLADLISSYSEWGGARRDELRSAVTDLESKVSRQPHELAAAERELRALLWLAAADREQGYALESISGHDGVALDFNQFIKQGLDGSVKPGDALVLNFTHLGTRSVEYRELAGKGSGSLDSRLAAAREVAAGSARRLSELRMRLADSELTALSEALKDPAFVAHVAKRAAELNLGPVGFFVTKGLFGEDYFDYSGYFYAGSISRSDKALMLRVKAGELLPVDAKIDDPGEFLKRMNAAELREGRGILLSIASYIFGEEYKRAAFTIDWRDVVFKDSGLQPGRLAELLRGMLMHGAETELIDYLMDRVPEVLLSAVHSGAACGIAPWREMAIARILSIGQVSVDVVGVEPAETFEEIVSSITDGAQFVSSMSDATKVKAWMDDRQVWFSQIDEVLDHAVMEGLIALNAPSVNIHNIQSMGRFFNPPLKSGSIGVWWIRAQAEGALKNWLVSNHDLALEAVLEQDSDLVEDADDVKWIIAKTDSDEALHHRAVEKLNFRARSLEGFPQGLWLRMIIKQRADATWENIEKALGSAPDDELLDVVSAVLSSERSLEQLGNDFDSNDKVKILQIEPIVKRLAQLSGEHEQALARFLSRSGVAVALPSDFESGLSSDSVKLMMEGLPGQWCEWLWGEAAEIDGPWLAQYLASCVADPRALEGKVDIPAAALIDAASMIVQPGTVEQLLTIYISRVTDWGQATSDAACALIAGCEITSAGAAMRILRQFHPIPMIREATTGPAFELLARVVGQAGWVTAKPLISAASNSSLAGLSGEKGTATLPESKEAIALANSMHAAGLIRKPKHRKGSLVLVATAKF